MNARGRRDLLVAAAILGLAVLATFVTLRFAPRPGTAASTGPTQLLALIVPRQALANERYVLYASVDHLPAQATILTRLCRQDGHCVLERTTEADPGAWRGWLGAFTASPGEYIGHLFVRTPGPGGERTIASVAWGTTVRE